MPRHESGTRAVLNVEVMCRATASEKRAFPKFTPSSVLSLPACWWRADSGLLDVSPAQQVDPVERHGDGIAGLLGRLLRLILLGGRGGQAMPRLGDCAAHGGRHAHAHRFPSGNLVEQAIERATRSSTSR